jgi:hypothetical protein
MYSPADLEKLIPPEPKKRAATGTLTGSPAISGDDEALIEHGRRVLGPVFCRLMDGDRGDYGNTSDADHGAIKDTLRLTGGDADRAERILRSREQLARSKWDDPRPSKDGGSTTWLRYSIDRALEAGIDPLPTINGNGNGHPEPKGGDCPPGEDLVCLPRAEYERLATRDREFDRWRTETAALFRNPDLSAADKLVHFSLVNEFTWNGEPHRIRLKEFGRRVGMSDRAVARSVDRIGNKDDSAAPWRKSVTRERLEQPLVNPKTGEITEWVSCVEIAPRAKGPTALLKAGAAFRPKDKVDWGGPGRKNRRACDEHPEAAVIATTHLECSVCHRDLGAEEPVIRKPESLNVQLVRSDAARPHHPPGVVLSPGVQDVHSGPAAPADDAGFTPREGEQPPSLARDLLMLGGRLGFAPIVINGRTYRGRAEWERFTDPSMLPHLPAAIRAAEYAAGERG